MQWEKRRTSELYLLCSFLQFTVAMLIASSADMQKDDVINPFVLPLLDKLPAVSLTTAPSTSSTTSAARSTLSLSVSVVPSTTFDSFTTPSTVPPSTSGLHNSNGTSITADSDNSSSLLIIGSDIESNLFAQVCKSFPWKQKIKIGLVLGHK